MKATFDGKLDVEIYTLDSEEAKGRVFMSSTNVLLDDRPVPLDIALDSGKMKTFLDEQLGGLET